MLWFNDMVKLDARKIRSHRIRIAKGLLLLEIGASILSSQYGF